MSVLDPSISDAAFRAVRQAINESGYGSMVSDENCRNLSDKAAQAAVAAYVKLHPNKNQPLLPS